jgi:hypothetical protein
LVHLATHTRSTHSRVQSLLVAQQVPYMASAGNRLHDNVVQPTTHSHRPPRPFMVFTQEYLPDDCPRNKPCKQAAQRGRSEEKSTPGGALRVRTRRTSAAARILL